MSAFVRILIFILTSVFVTACGSTDVFNPKSAYPPDPWVKGYSDPDDCLGGEDLAAIDFELPSYPERSFKTGRQGWTIIRLDIDAYGETENIRIERALPEGLFDSSSRKAVDAWRFRPPAQPLKDCRILLRYRAGTVSLGS